MSVLNLVLLSMGLASITALICAYAERRERSLYTKTLDDGSTVILPNPHRGRNGGWIDGGGGGDGGAGCAGGDGGGCS